MLTATSATTLWVTWRTMAAYTEWRKSRAKGLTAASRLEWGRRLLLMLWWVYRSRIWYRMIRRTYQITNWLCWKTIYLISYGSLKLDPLLDVTKEMLYASLQWYPETFWQHKRRQMQEIDEKRKDNSLGSGWVIVSDEIITVGPQAAAPPPSAPERRCMITEQPRPRTGDFPQTPQLAPILLEDAESWSTYAQSS